MTRASILLAGIVLLLASAPRAQYYDGTIGVAWDPEGRVCERTVAPGTDGTFYILAYLTGFFGYGMTGAEFRLDGFPTEWSILSITPNPISNIQIGNPLAGGCNMAFPQCMTGTDGVVVLYTVHFFATSLVTQRVLSVREHSNPSNPMFACPNMVGCDAPCSCRGCSNGGTAAINDPDYCIVGVASRSWSEVRSLYR